MNKLQKNHEKELRRKKRRAALLKIRKQRKGHLGTRHNKRAG